MTLKKLMSLRSDEVCAYIQQRIRERYGDAVENASRVYARNGYYFIESGAVKVSVRRVQLPALLRSLHLVISGGKS